MNGTEPEGLDARLDAADEEMLDYISTHSSPARALAALRELAPSQPVPDPQPDPDDPSGLPRTTTFAAEVYERRPRHRPFADDPRPNGSRPLRDRVPVAGLADMVTCPECEGTGRVRPRGGVPCRVCWMTGVVPGWRWQQLMDQEADKRRNA